MDNNTIAGVYVSRKAYHSLYVDDKDIQLQYMLKYLPAERNIPILDAGCGNGKYAIKLKSLQYNNITAVDLFESIPVEGLSYREAGIEDLPFEDRTFQFIYANSVIYYPADTKKAIGELARVLKPGGVLFLTAHTRYSLFTLRRLILRWFNSRKARHLRDVRFKSSQKYIHLLKEEGFEMLRIDGFKLSFFIIPTYDFVRKAVKKALKLRFPEIQYTITKLGFMARVKSMFAYHMVLIARKPL